MENETKKQVENINNSNEKLLLSNVSESVCKHVFTAYDNTIDDYRCIWCGQPLNYDGRNCDKGCKNKIKYDTSLAYNIYILLCAVNLNKLC